MSRHPGASYSRRGDVSPINTDVQSTLSQISPVSEFRGLNQHQFVRRDREDNGLDVQEQQQQSGGNDNTDIVDRSQLARATSMRTNVTATPGADNLSYAAIGGGISGIAFGVANRNERESGVEAIRSLGEPSAGDRRSGYYNGPSERGYSDIPNGGAVASEENRGTTELPETQPLSSMPLGGTALAASASPQQGTPSLTPSNPSQLSVVELYPRYPSGGLYDGPYNSYNSHDPTSINPNDIADDGDDGLMDVSQQPQQRRSWLFGRSSNQGLGAAGAAGAAGGAAAGGILGAVSSSLRGGSTTYGPVPGGAGEATQMPLDKDALLAQQSAIAAAKRRKKWMLTLLIAFVIVAVIVGAIVGGIVGSQSHGDSKSTDDSSSGSSSDPGTNIETAAGDLATNGDLNKNSPEIKKLMNNTNLHRVFHGMDYTSWGVQYPLCLKYPPSQNNVTRDMAVLSQLTNTVRVYGTDCNQTQMVLHALDRLEITDMKLWLGVWINSNETTSNRQIQILYDVIDSMNDTSIIDGVIVGNEVLYSGDFSSQATAEKALTTYLQDVRSNLTSKGLNVPVATSDLGDNWSTELLDASDLVMANVHPFFGGVPVDQAATWTVNFFDEHDVSLTKGTNKSAIISEVGWPSAGGNDCGESNCTESTQGAVAGIDEMNQFLSDWVCQALNNGTKYFWFEAFDEPWKVIYNTPGEDWETKWGLMDSARKLKTGLTIPDCDGKTV